MSTTEPAPDYLSVDEIRTAIEVMTDAAWVRLDKIARSYSRNRRLEPDDLLQTALTRALEGKRRCPRTVDVMRFLAEAMRSIANDDLKAQKRKPELRLVPRHGGEDEPVEYDYPDRAPNAEDALGDEQESARILEEVLLLFEDDVVAQTIVEGDAEGMEAQELRDLTGLDGKAYASKRRLIRRRIDRAFPKGWNP